MLDDHDQAEPAASALCTISLAISLGLAAVSTSGGGGPDTTHYLVDGSGTLIVDGNGTQITDV